MATLASQALARYITEQTVAGGTVTFDQIIFANIPNLTNENLAQHLAVPPNSQIVHRQAISQKGVVNENAVVYSVTLGTEVGDFNFNFIGLINSTKNLLAIGVNTDLIKKIRNNNETQGNSITRSILLEFTGAKAITNITIPAQTWQIDFTARLQGLDEKIRLTNKDIYGRSAFFADGFKVSRKTGREFYIEQGVGYIEGVRTENTARKTITASRLPCSIYVDTSIQNTVTGEYQTIFTLLQQSKNDWRDTAGFAHYVEKIADIDSSGNVTDRRNIHTLPTATTENKGVTQLSSATNSNREDMAATPKAVKTAYDLANSKQSPATTLAGYGIGDFKAEDATGDMNTFKTNGIYSFNSPSQTQNAPTSDAGYHLVVLAGGNQNWVRQTAYKAYSNEIYERYQSTYNGSFSQWRRIDFRAVDTVSLSSAVNSTSTSVAANSLAVKTAYDKAMEANTAANTAKTTADNAQTAAQTAQRTANSKQSPATTFAGYGITGQQLLNGHLRLKNSDYSSIQLENNSGRYVQLESTPDSRGDIANLIYKERTGSGLFTIKFKKKNGTALLDSDLSSAINSSSNATPASSAAVKTAYDLANSKQSPATTLAGYGITGQQLLNGHLRLKNSDYSSIQLENNSGRYVRLESAPDSSGDFANLIYKERTDSNIYSVKFRKKSGTVLLGSDMSDAANSDSRETIASSKALKTAYDKALEAIYTANQTERLVNSKVSRTDISDSVSSNSQTTIASSRAVKIAYDKAVEAIPTYRKVGDFEIHKFSDGTMIQTYFFEVNDLNHAVWGERNFIWAEAFVAKPLVFTHTEITQGNPLVGAGLRYKSTSSRCYYHLFEYAGDNQGRCRVSFMAIGRWRSGPINVVW